MIENMVARDGVEPPTPAFSERNFQVVSTTYKVPGDCLTTCKYVVGGRKTGGRNGWTPSRMVNWARSIGPNTAQLLERILNAKPHLEIVLGFARDEDPKTRECRAYKDQHNKVPWLLLKDQSGNSCKSGFGS